MKSVAASREARSSEEGVLAGVEMSEYSKLHRLKASENMAVIIVVVFRVSNKLTNALKWNCSPTEKEPNGAVSAGPPRHQDVQHPAGRRLQSQGKVTRTRERATAIIHLNGALNTSSQAVLPTSAVSQIVHHIKARVGADATHRFASLSALLLIHGK
jgi:hypothetical protein